MTTNEVAAEQLLKAANAFRERFPSSEVLTEVRMSSPTFDALRRILPSVSLRAFSVLVQIVDDIPDGEYRMVFADGSVRVVVNGMEVATIPTATEEGQ